MSDKYALIAAEQATGEPAPSVSAMCSGLEVSRSGFYDWQRAEPSKRQRRRAKVTRHVHGAFEAGRGTYGVRRVHAILTRCTDPEVASASIDLVRAIMREEGLAACQPRAYKVTTEQDPDADPIRDRLHRDFTADTPGAKLVGDITYIKTWEGWLYLATVIDCCTTQVLGWSMADHMRTDLICDALTMAATGHQQPVQLHGAGRPEPPRWRRPGSRPRPRRDRRPWRRRRRDRRRRHQPNGGRAQHLPPRLQPGRTPRHLRRSVRRR
ncbi:hypothetical protein BJY21_003252 [Kineosphaera limosa]|uniref:Putative transposase n=1 Tax=Kineosphaera limosa NBRC 100340 TaxID=1184609 RepID=K6WTC7_9MICO|nr:hypothetical protein [Kineosphaera limosa]GAB95327.1 putative transposase [Kineosphaera limosa NBRC 100340]